MARKKSNGEGSITKRKNGTWMGRVTVGRNEDGSVKRQTVYGKTKQEVVEKTTKILNELQTGTYIEATKLTLGQWLDTWLWDYKKPSVRPNTFSSYEQNVRIHIKPEIGDVLLKELKPVTIQKFYNSKHKDGDTEAKDKISAATIKKIHNIIHEALEQAIKNDILNKNVSERVSLPRLIKEEVRVLTKEEQKSLLEFISGDRLECAFILDLATGLRIGELLGLRWKDIDLKEGVVRVNQSLNRIKEFKSLDDYTTKLHFGEIKTRSGRRSIPIPKNVIKALNAHKARQDEEKSKYSDDYQDKDLVFCTELGTPLEPRNLMRKFYSIVDNLKIPEANFHCMRHTFATRALEAGINPKVVQEMLGHANISMTLDTYSHVLPDTKRAAADKLNALFGDDNEEEDNPESKDEVNNE
jgi:integrase